MTSPAHTITLYDAIGGHPALTAAVDDFFARLIADPELGPFFPQGVGARHRGYLVTVLGEALGGLAEALRIGHTRALGSRHVGYGVRVGDYRTVGDALLAALAATLGDDFDSATREAWVTAYSLVSETMLQGAAARPVTR